MIKMIGLRNVLLLILLISIVPLTAHAQNPIDSLRNLINSRKADNTQKAEWLIQIAYLHYYSSQNEELVDDIIEAKKIINKINDKCFEAKIGVIEAQYFRTLKMQSESIQKSKEVLNFARENNCGEAEIDILLNLAYLKIRQNKDSSLIYIKQAITRADEINDSVMIGKSNSALAYFYARENQFQKSTTLLIRNYKLFLRLRNHLRAGDAFSDLANNYYMESKYDSALFYAKKAEPLLIKGYGNYSLANNYNNMAIIYQNTGYIEEAINVYYKGLKIAEKYNISSLINIFRYNLGNCYYSLNAKEKAAESYRACLKIARQANDTSSIIYSLSALGNVALDTKKNDTASLYLQESFDLALKTNDTYMLSYLASSIANLKIKQKEYIESQKFIDKAYEYARTINSPEDMIGINISQALLYADTKRVDKSIKLLLSALGDAKKINSVDSYRYGLESLAEVYEKQNDYKNALVYFQKVKKFEDSTKITAKLERFVNIELQFEQEKAERIRQLEIEKDKLERDAKLRESRLISLLSILATIALLVISLFLYLLSKSNKRRVQILQEKNRIVKSHRDELADLVSKLTVLTEELKISNHTKSKLFSIIGHDLKIPFHILQGYANILLTEEPDKETRDIYYKRISNSSEQLVEMINTLLEWAMAQSGTIGYKPVLFDITKATNDLITTSQINADKKSIEIIKEFDQNQDMMIYADKNMFGRILHNLISNAIKFTPKNGSVSVGWKLEQDQIKFFVKDTGIGMPAEQAATIFEKSMDLVKNGTDGEKGTGLGLSICKEFVKKHKGQIWAESELGKGSQFYFNFPVKQNNP